MGSPFDRLRKGLGSLLQAQQVKVELAKVLERREQAIQRLGEGMFRLISDGLMQPHPSTKDAYLDARALDERARELKKLIAEGDTGPIPEPQQPDQATTESELETRPASADEGPPGADEEVPVPAEVRGRLGACPCGGVIPPGAKYCPLCGMPTEPPEKTIAPPRKCRHCGSEVPPGADFCPECGGHADQEVYEV